MLLLMLFALPAQAKPKAAYRLNHTSLVVKTGKGRKLKMLNNKNRKVKWSVDRPDLISFRVVSKNCIHVYGLKHGKAVVTARIGRTKYKCTVTIKKSPYMKVKNLKLKVGEQAPLKLTYGNKKHTRWNTSDGTIATCSVVAAAGMTVSAWKEGTAVIWAEHKGKTYKCKVTVIPNPDIPDPAALAPNQIYTRPDQPDVTKGDLAAAFCERVAVDSHYGYDNRDDYRWAQRQGDRADYSCSSMIIDAYEHVGVPVRTAGANKTADMYGFFLANGFTDVTKSINLKTGAGLQRGDVLVKPGKHTEIYVGNGLLCGARGNANSGHAENGYPGDQTGGEIMISGYFNFPWKYVLRYGEGSSIY